MHVNSKILRINFFRKIPQIVLNCQFVNLNVFSNLWGFSSFLNQQSENLYVLMLLKIVEKISRYTF